MVKKRDPKQAQNRVREFRRKKAWTRTELARKARVTARTVDRMEKGLPTREETQLRVASALEQEFEVVFPNNES